MNWDHIPKNRNMKSLFTSNSQFENCKKTVGVGQTAILKFLLNKYK